MHWIIVCLKWQKIIINNEIYIHDLNSYAIGSHNGFNTRQTDVRPAQSVSTAFQLVAVIFQLQSLQQFGGVSASHIDWTMIPYVRKSFRKHLKDGCRYISRGDSILEKLSKTLSSILNH